MTDEATVEERPYGTKITVKSKRGTNPRDQDQVTIESYYDDLSELDSDEQEILNLTLKDQLRKARKNDPNGDREE